MLSELQVVLLLAVIFFLGKSNVSKCIYLAFSQTGPEPQLTILFSTLLSQLLSNFLNYIYV